MRLLLSRSPARMATNEPTNSRSKTVQNGRSARSSSCLSSAAQPSISAGLRAHPRTKVDHTSLANASGEAQAERRIFMACQLVSWQLGHRQIIRFCAPRTFDSQSLHKAVTEKVSTMDGGKHTASSGELAL
jgi:hypothetical protein